MAIEAFTYPFLEAVRDAVNADDEFRKQTSFFDGSVQWHFGELIVWQKWYRGQIIDMHEGPDMLGFTFSLSAPRETWQEVLDMPRKSYQPWAKLFQFGEIATGGNIIEATRVLPAQFVVVSHIRSIGRGSEDA